MSSFEHFKKSQHSQKSHRSSQASFKSFEVEAPNLANVSFSTSDIVFCWNETQDTLINQELKVANRTGTRLYYQVATSHPDYYDIRPRQDILEINAIASISFRLYKKKILEHENRGSSSFRKLKDFLKNNVIQFSWGEISVENIKYNQIPRINNRQTLRIILEGSEAAAFEPKTSGRNVSITKSYNQELNPKENRMMGEPKGFDESNRGILEGEETGQYSSLLTIPIIAMVAISSFLVGYISA